MSAPMRGFPESVRLSEVVHVIDEEYRYRGETRHRQRNKSEFGACCLDCMWTKTDTNLPRLRREARAHQCPTVEALPLSEIQENAGPLHGRRLMVNPEPLRVVMVRTCRGCGKRAPWCSCGRMDYQ